MLSSLRAVIGKVQYVALTLYKIRSILLNMTRYKDVTGCHFGKLTVIRYEGSTKDDRARWLCKCECGKETIVLLTSLTSGNTVSCGCVLNEKLTKHNMSDTKIYHVWQSMKTRCTNQKSNRYKYYGGKGISYDLKWKTFEGFYEDMGKEYKEGVILDRIDGSKNYTKDNCRWVDYIIQNNNKADNVKIEYNGMLYSPQEISKTFLIPLSTIYNRIQRGWSTRQIINTPVQSKYNSTL